MNETTQTTNAAAITALEQALGSLLVRIAKHRASPLNNTEQFLLRQDITSCIINSYSIFQDYSLARSIGITLLDAYTP